MSGVDFYENNEFRGMGMDSKSCQKKSISIGILVLLCVVLLVLLAKIFVWDRLPKQVIDPDGTTYSAEEFFKLINEGKISPNQEYEVK